LEMQRPSALLVGPQFHGAPSVREWLHRRRCECFLVPTLGEARASIRQRRFDLVLCGSQLPDGAGSSLIEILQGLPVSLFISYPVEDDCIWLPAILDGVNCWGKEALKPKAFMPMIEEVISANRKKSRQGKPLNGDGVH